MYTGKGKKEKNWKIFHFSGAQGTEIRRKEGEGEKGERERKGARKVRGVVEKANSDQAIVKGTVRLFKMEGGGPRNLLQLSNTVYFQRFLTFLWRVWPLRTISWCHR